MMEKKSYILRHSEARRLATEAIKQAPDGYHVKIMPPTRSLDQNARLWSLLGEVSSQVNWHGRKLCPEDWKTVFTASLKQMQVVPNIDNTGFVALGQSTSKMTIKEMVDLQDLITAFGIQQGVKFSEFLR